ncbi:hypothetical protein DERF_015892 [Dermatophagoides farinae]|uniref:Uncharacterized protein n=1 Tax=Dermatophagoides farinae TaxID=6954 RepID=A0A922HK52_DERFA|nr:hypothetical protein DERF_015892 [Dermatophagoides farinae]
MDDLNNFFWTNFTLVLVLEKYLLVFIRVRLSVFTVMCFIFESESFFLHKIERTLAICPSVTSIFLPFAV